MKKLIISGSAKLQERACYWRGYFEGQGYEVIDYPTPAFSAAPDDIALAPGLDKSPVLSPSDPEYPALRARVYRRFWKNLSEADVLVVMNDEKNGIDGYIGYGAMGELEYFLANSFNTNRTIEIYLTSDPNPEQSCYDEIKFWLDQGWLKIWQHDGKARPARRRESTPVKDAISEPIPATTAITPPATAIPPLETEPTRTIFPFTRTDDALLDITTCRHKALRPLSLTAREYLKLLSPTFPAWLLRYISAPEFQRLTGVNMMGAQNYTGLCDPQVFRSVFDHSIGTALILWRFTHDKRQTLSALFHDIASPSFKHAIDYLNGDAETQESIEDKTGDIIRNSRAIMRQLKRDEILPSEISDYHLYPLADNAVPGLAADRLEYTLANGYFCYQAWTLADVKRFYNDLTIFVNEDGLDELGFSTPEIAADFSRRNLTFSSDYHCDRSRLSLQFVADIIKAMIDKSLLTLDDLFIMSERETIDWFLGCGDRSISEAFRQFQRSTSFYTSSSARKNTYATSVKPKVRYIIPLVATPDGSITRIDSIDPDFAKSLKDYLSEKQARYVGFDFDFQPDAD